MDVEEEIIQLLMNKYGWTREEVMNSDNFEELGLDSLTIYSLITECETKFQVQLDIDDITDINSAIKFIDYVKERVRNEKRRDYK